jgi:hypothetical protein
MATTSSTSIKFSAYNDCSGHSLEVVAISADEYRITASHYEESTEKRITATITIDKSTLLDLLKTVNIMLSM